MEISNFVQSALAGINLVGFDASLHGAIVPGDLISGLLASLPYSRWLMFGYTGTGVSDIEVNCGTSVLFPVSPVALVVQFGVCVCPNYGGVGNWGLMLLSSTGIGFQLLQKNLSLASPIHPGWLGFSPLAVTGGFNARFSLVDSRANDYVNKVGIYYRWAVSVAPVF